jgi:2-polyprenyl-3-methyl-5-hydroxy-6-metoxy-1,4-benzoquinol methylase
MVERKNDSCPTCRSEQILKIWPRCRFNKNTEIRWCKKCGFGWQHPLPTPNDIRNYYQKYSAYNIHGENEKEKGFQKRIKQINKMMPKRGNLIDVGSGLGYFLKVAIENGWKATGIEPHASAAEYCKDNLSIDVYTGFVDNIKLRPESFDVVTLWDVLEHVHDPLIFLAKCVEFLRPGGLLIFAVPNASGLPARIFKGKWRYCMYTHLNYFSIPYIYKMADINNLEIELTNNTIKIHSLLQGITSFLPMDIDVEGIIRLGRKNSSEHGRPEQIKSNFKSNNSIFGTNILNRLRRVAHNLNLVYFQTPVGDLVDVYCRKKIKNNDAVY